VALVPNEIIALTPLAILTIAGLAAAILGTLGLKRQGMAGFALIAIVLAGVFSFASLYDVPGFGYVRDAVEALPVSSAGVPTVYGVYDVTPFSVFFAAIFLLVAGIVVLASPHSIRERHQGEYYALILFSTLGMMVVASARELITLFVGLELASFCTYALAGFYKKAPDSAEAAMKYFVIGSLSSAVTLYGISLIYGLAGTTNLDALSGGLVGAPGLIDPATGRIAPTLVFGWVFVLTGFAFKVSAVPFHMWSVDVYDGAPPTVSAFLAAASKKMGFAAIFKIFIIGLVAVQTNWTFLAAALAVVTMTVGNVVALSQTNVRRLLAYSSIAHAGYMLIALPIATQFALAGGLLHITTHAFMKAGAFVVVAAVATLGVSEDLNDWRGLSRRAPFLALAMAIFMLSFAGIPPFAGFASKFVLFSAAIQAGGWFVWLAVAGVVNSAISLYYYARIVRTMYVDEGGATTRLAIPASAIAAVAIALLGTIVIGLYPAPFYGFAVEAAASLIP